MELETTVFGAHCLDNNILTENVTHGKQPLALITSQAALLSCRVKVILALS
jgi:hypothetical protein